MSNSSGYPFFPGPPRKVFVDLGPFDGASVRLFLTNDLSDKGNWGTTAFALNGGKLRASSKTSPGAVFNQSEWEVVAVEANPNNSGHLERQRATMLAQGTVKNYTLIAGTAIGVRNGNITLTLDNDNRGNEGSTTMNESLSAVGTRLVIPSLDIVTLFSDVIRPRRNDTIIVKMDIEGAEYDVLSNLLQHGTVCGIDGLYIGTVDLFARITISVVIPFLSFILFLAEYHQNQVTGVKPPHDFHQSLVFMVSKFEHCNVDIGLMSDDEYVQGLDLFPLPPGPYNITRR
jgi:FkbM family methyltransferase